MDVVTINGMLDPVERAHAIQRVEEGSVSILYISPESFRSKTIERLLVGRKVVRFVIDEAHCFSAWGQDFRVDYLYIGDFIRLLQEQKGGKQAIPVSCFTATAKQNVIQDIKDYFFEKLNIRFKTFCSGSTRKNLKYKVFKVENEDEKYGLLRSIIEDHDCPAYSLCFPYPYGSQSCHALAAGWFFGRYFSRKDGNPDENIQSE